MVKVKCIICGDTGYTASPDYLVCKCGGRFKVILEDKKRGKTPGDKNSCLKELKRYAIFILVLR